MATIEAYKSKWPVNELDSIHAIDSSSSSRFRTTKLWILVFCTFPLLANSGFSIRPNITLFGNNLSEFDLPLFLLLVLAVAAINFFIIATQHHRFSVHMSRFQIAFILLYSILFLVQCLNTTRSESVKASVALDARLLLLIILLVVIFIFFTGDKELISKVLKTIIISTTIMLVIYLFQYLVIHKSAFLGVSWGTATRTGKNVMGLYLALVTPIALWKYLSEKLLSLWVIPVVVHIFALVYLLSRGAWVSTAVSLGVMLALTFLRLAMNKGKSQQSIFNIMKKVLVVCGLLVVIFLFATTATQRGALQSRFSSLIELRDVGSEMSISTRTNVLKQGMAYFWSSPITGIGTSNFRSRTGIATHNEYLTQLSEQGILGMTPFLILIILILREVFKPAEFTWESMALKTSSLAAVIYLFFTAGGYTVPPIVAFSLLLCFQNVESSSNGVAEVRGHNKVEVSNGQLQA